MRLISLAKALPTANFADLKLLFDDAFVTITKHAKSTNAICIPPFDRPLLHRALSTKEFLSSNDRCQVSAIIALINGATCLDESSRNFFRKLFS